MLLFPSVAQYPDGLFHVMLLRYLEQLDTYTFKDAKRVGDCGIYLIKPLDKYLPVYIGSSTKIGLRVAKHSQFSYAQNSEILIHKTANLAQIENALILLFTPEFNDKISLTPLREFLANPEKSKYEEILRLVIEDWHSKK